ncbi:MAG: rhodanese-like domain-containing protein, partial [Ideonella sp.]
MSSRLSDTVPSVDATALKAWLHDGDEIALLDVREYGQFGESHLFYGVSLPYSRLEIDVRRLVPRRATRVVVHDEGDGSDVAARAAAILLTLGYAAVHVLAGGIAAWREAGFASFSGVNVPSKTFGELAEIAFHTPRIGARELAERVASGDNLIILDGRPLTEFGKMNIPGGICCPNGELALRAETLAPDPSTTIVVNCAGRTRSIIGAQTLINMGVPNPVLALENGTQGWFLEGLTLEHGASRRYPDEAASSHQPRQRANAVSLAERFGVRFIDAAQLDGWLGDSSRTTVLCDVRTAEEFARGTLPHAQHTPGGQLLQATDQYVGVRRARLVVFDGEMVRAPAVASWLVQMGWDASVLHVAPGALQCKAMGSGDPQQPSVHFT